MASHSFRLFAACVVVSLLVISPSSNSNEGTNSSSSSSSSSSPPSTFSPLQLTSTFATNLTNSPESTWKNDTDNGELIVHEGKGFSNLWKNNNAILRAVYVACGIVVLVIIYNLIMTRLRRKKSKLQLYGVLKNNSEVEMTPLGQEENDDDMTMFDASLLKYARR